MKFRFITLILFFWAMQAVVSAPVQKQVHLLPPPPASESGAEQGVSAASMVLSGSVLYVAGGCNFPEQPAVYGGLKRYYSRILGWSGNDWWIAGSLRQALAYGVALPAPGGFIYIGGQNAKGSQSAVDLYHMQDGGMPVIESLPSLPSPVDNMAGVRVGNRIFIAGGNVGGKPSNSLFMLDLSDIDAGWQLLSEFPGRPRVQPVLASAYVNGQLQLYVWGGFDAGESVREPSVLVDGLRYNVDANEWVSLLPPVDRSGKAVSLGGGTATVWNDSLIVCTGGVNAFVFQKALQRESFFSGVEAFSLRQKYLLHDPSWYGFNGKVLVFNIHTRQWTEVMEDPRFARAGAAAVCLRNELVLFQGELKPGVRSPHSYRVLLPEDVVPVDIIDNVNLSIDSDLCAVGNGISDQLLIMPIVGAGDLEFENTATQSHAYASGFSRRHVSASPGYYSVWLDRYDVYAEHTTTQRAAIHRYTFPESKSAGFVLDMNYSLQKHFNTLMEIEVVNSTTIRGRKYTQDIASVKEIAFYAVFSKPFTYSTTEETVSDSILQKTSPVKKMLLHFETEAQEQVLMKIGISHVDMNGALANLQQEIPDWDFDGVRRNARAQWRTYLSDSKIETPDRSIKEAFYTALYLSASAPDVLIDVDGRYKGKDKQIRISDTPIDNTVYSLINVFRSLYSEGSENCRQMSAMYVMNVLGFFQISPGDSVYAIGRPLFDKASLKLPGNKRFEIVTVNNSPDNKYIKDVKFNRKSLQTHSLTHKDLMKGGRMVVVMSNKPSRLELE